MNLSRFAARRYLLSSRLPNALNIITLIAMVGVGLGGACLIIVLSVFNGFYVYIREIYENFDPDIRIEAEKGRYLAFSEATLKELRSHPAVARASYSLEGRAIVKNGEQQRIVQLKGVTREFREISGIAALVTEGRYGLKTVGGDYGMVIGQELAYYLNAYVSDWEAPLEVFTVTGEKDIMVTAPEDLLNKQYVLLSGVFALQDYDKKLAITDIAVAQKLFETKDEISAWEIKLKDPDDAEAVKAELAALAGENARALTWYEQHQTIYEVMRNEKAAGYIIIFFMLLLISFNIVGSLTMIVIEKKKDIGMLQAMGAEKKIVRNIFLYEGFYIGGIGGLFGLALGYALSILHDQYGIFSLNTSEAQTLVMDDYPIALLWTDFVWVFATIFALSALSGLYPAAKAAASNVIDNLRS